MLPVVSLLTVIIISMIVVKVATVALTLTGISEPLARFQARSAFTGTGFTTAEAEKVVQHPVRRRIVMLLMLLGNAGIVGVMSSLMLSFADGDSQQNVWVKFISLMLGLCVLWWIANSPWLNRQMTRVIKWALQRWTDIEIRDYAGLLHLTGDFVVAEMQVRRGDWLCDRDLSSLRLNSEGVLVLGIERTDGSYIGAPRGTTTLQDGDVLLVYGRQPAIAELDERRSGARGNWDHHKAVDKQRQLELAEEDAAHSGESTPVDSASTEG